MRRWIWTSLLLLSLALPSVVGAEDPIRVTDQWVESSFRDHITFSIRVQGDHPITEARLLYRVEGLPATARGDADFEPGADIEATFTIDQRRDYLPPGAELTYWWKITDQVGGTLKTDPQSLQYMDDRRDWETLENERLALYWYKGGQSFGEALFEQANITLDQIENEAGVYVEKQVRIFIYGSHRDLLDSIAVGAQEWTGGQAFTEFGVVVLGVSPSDIDFGLVATPHELTHIVIHRATDNPYGDLPHWLDEGLAVYMSGEIDVDWRGYRELVATRAGQDRLMTLQTLSSSFPADSNLALQAYAQSGLVVEFIIKEYGSETMAHLLEIFSEGTTYDDALLEVLGVDTWGLDNAWRQSIGAPTLEVPAVGGETPVVEALAVTATSTPAPAATPTASEDAESTPAGGGLLPCLGSSLASLTVLMMFVFFRAR